MIFKSVSNNVVTQSSATASSTKASSVKVVHDPKCSQPRWCPAVLTHSQKRKLQRLRAKDKREQEAERVFNETHPVYPQKKREPPQDAKTAAEVAAKASPDYPAASAGLSDESDCPVHLLQHPRHCT